MISWRVIADQLGLAYCGATLQLKGGHHARRFQRLLDPTDKAATAATAVAAATGDEVPAELSDAELSDDDEAQEETEQNGAELVQRYCKHLRQWTQLRYIQITLWARPRTLRFPFFSCQKAAWSLSTSSRAMLCSKPGSMCASHRELCRVWCATAHARTRG